MSYEECVRRIMMMIQKNSNSTFCDKCINNNNNNKNLWSNLGQEKYTRVGTLIVATIYLQLIQNRYMFRSFTQGLKPL